MDEVRLSVTRLDPAAMMTPGTVLLDVIETDDTVAERAIAWATVRGYDRLVPVLERMLTGESPESGFAVVINRSHALHVFATWPWCPKPHLVDGAPRTGSPEEPVTTASEPAPARDPLPVNVAREWR